MEDWAPSALDMEALLQGLSTCFDGHTEFLGLLSENQDVLMMDPYLDYINDMLMEEGMEEMACMEQEPNFQAMLDSFSEVVGESSLPQSSSGSTSLGDSSDLGLWQQQENSSCEEILSDVNDTDLSTWINAVLDPASPMSLPLSNISTGQSETGANRSTNFSPKDNALDLEERAYMVASLHDNHNLNEINEPPKLNLRVSYGSSNGAGFSFGSNKNMAKAYHDVAEVRNETSGYTMLNKNKPQQQGAVLDSHSGNGRHEEHFQQPSPNGNDTTKHTENDLSFQDLEMKADYNSLYVEKSLNVVKEIDSRTCSNPAQGSTRKNGKVQRSSAAANRKATKSHSSVKVEASVDLREVLVSCAHAVSVGDARRASDILRELRHVHGASPYGSGLQRTAHYFCDALVARMNGTGGLIYKSACDNRPSAAATLKVLMMGFKLCPYVKIVHYFANQNILKMAHGASRLHVVDYGFQYGMQWPCLVNALADRKGGPPLLIITGIEFPQAGKNPLERLEESGQRLAAYAKSYNVPFEFRAVVSNKWEDLDSTTLHIRRDEVLVINSVKRLRHLGDESIELDLMSAPRQRLLTRMHEFKPDLLLIAVVNSNYSSPFFVSRFREALYYFSNAFDMLDTLYGDNPDRLMMESKMLYHSILNVVACEGTERMERAETYKQWQARIQTAGFEPLPIQPSILSNARSHVKKYYHKDFAVHDDANCWMLLGWKGRPSLAIAAWKPNSTVTKRKHRSGKTELP